MLARGPVMSELLALAARLAPTIPSQAFRDLGYKGSFRLDAVGARDDDVPEHVVPFASDHNSYYGLFTKGEPKTTDECPVVFVDWGADDFDYGEPPVRIIAADLVTFLSQLAYGEHDDPEEYEDDDDDDHPNDARDDMLEQRAHLATLTGVTQAHAEAEVPRELARMRFEHECMEAYNAELGDDDLDEDD